MEREHSESSASREETQGFSSDKLLPIIYRELRHLAATRLRSESGYQTLQPSALVHEAWVRVSESERSGWKNQAHFFGAAAIAMRRIMVERARMKKTVKRTTPVDVATFEHDWVENDDHIVMIHECLTILEKTDPDLAKVVLLRFYGGLGSEEIGRFTGNSLRTVERQWMVAKAKLYRLIVAQQKSQVADE